MAFDPNKFLAEVKGAPAPERQPSSGFDPRKFLSEVQGSRSMGALPGMAEKAMAPAQESSIADRLQTQAESAYNAVTLGYLPQIQAGFEKFMGDPSGGVDEKLRSQGFTVPENDYVAMRDENIKRQQGQAKRNPNDALVGSLAGMVAMTPVIAATGGAAAPTMGARVAQSVATGFGLGAVSNPGDTEGVFDPLQGGDRLANATGGAVMGAGGQLLGEGIGKGIKVVKNLPGTLDKLSKNSAFKATGAMLKDFRAAWGRNSTEEIGETLLELNVVAAGDTFEDIAKKASAAKKATGAKIGSAYQQTEEALKQASQGRLSNKLRQELDSTVLDGDQIATLAKSRLKGGGRNDIANQKISEKASEALENLKTRGNDLTMEDLLEIKGNLDGDINYARKMGENPTVQQQLKVVRDAVNEAVKNRVRVAGKVLKDQDLVKNLEKANKQYGHLSTAEKTAFDRINRVDANNFFSLGDKIVGGAALGGDLTKAESSEDLVKSGMKALAAASLSKAGRSYGPALVSIAARKMGNALKTPALFQKYGKPIIDAAKVSPEELQALFNQLGKDPEFVSLYQLRGSN